MTTKPEINDYPLNQDYPIMLPVLVWVKIGELLQSIDNNSSFRLNLAAELLVQEINDLCFPEHFQKAEQAKEAQQRSERDPFQVFKQLATGMSDVNPDDFIGNPDE